MKLNRLEGMRSYLCGMMDRCPTNGNDWRDELTPFLESLDVKIYNPCKKPIDIGLEDIESRHCRQELKKEGKYE